MSTYILVHGAWHGAWCWKKVIPLLQAKGHKVLAPDLPGAGQDKTPIKEINFKAYTDKIGKLVEQEDKVILVGHSMGGMVITQLAEYLPNKIKSLVYLAAFLPKNDESLAGLAEKLPDGLVNPNLILSKDKAALSVKDAVILNAFYADCSEADIAMARSHLSPQAYLPWTEPVKTSESCFGKVHKVYIQCTKDQTLLYKAQQIMLAALPCDRVLKMETSHSPFLSAPQLLAKYLLCFSN